MFGNFGSSNLMWILVLLLVLGDGENGCGCGCDTLIWLLLLSKFCGGESTSPCGCGCSSAPRSCGCN